MLDLTATQAAKAEAGCDQEAVHAAQVTLLYNVLLNRNPDAGGFQHYMKLLGNGADILDIFQAFACSPEAAAAAPHNSYLRALRPAAAPSPQGTLAWKAEDRPITVDDRFSILQIELTNRCPFTCVMCPRTDHMTRHLGNMEFEVFQKIIDDLLTIDPDYGKSQDPIWLHHFGESLVHPRFGDFIRYARSRGIGTRMSINPLMLSDRIGDELLAAGPVQLQVSLDGHDNESFAKIRGVADAYDKSKRNLIRFLEKKIVRDNPVHVTLSVIDFPLNDRTEEENRAAWEVEWRKVPGIDAFLWKGFTTWNGDAPEIIAMDRFDASSATQLMRRYRDGFKVTCDWPWKRVVVAWNGDVLSCCYDYDAKYVLGNVQRQSLREIWNGKPMQALRREFVSGCVTNALCASCEYLRS